MDPGGLAAAAEALLLVCAANSAAWAAGRAVGNRWDTPLDFGFTLRDGTRLFGAHKTWGGLIAGTVATGVVAAGLGAGFALGIGFGVASLAGDTLSSAVKRRLRREPGAEVPLLDQVPEALLPLALFGPALGLDLAGMAGVTVAFALLDLATTRFRH